MKYCALIVGMTLMAQACSDKKEAAKPTNPIAPNTASVKVDGVLLPMSLSRTVAAIYDSRGGYLGVSIGGARVNDPVVTLILYEFQRKAGNVTFAVGSRSEINWTQDPSVGFFLNSRSCAASAMQVEIVEVDENKRMISGRFSSTVCGGSNNAQSKMVSEGEFNLPYTVR